MPGFVKTPADEKLWSKAKALAKDQGHEEDWPYITGIFKKMKGGKVAAITWDWGTIRNLVGHMVVGVELTDDHELAYLKFSNGSQAPVHLWQKTVPVDAMSIGRTASLINDPVVLDRAQGHTLVGIKPVVPGVIEFEFDNGIKVGLHEDWTARKKAAIWRSDDSDNAAPADPDVLISRLDALHREMYGFQSSDETEKYVKEHQDKNPGKVPGGLAKDKKPSDFDPKALAKGMDIEKEHTSDPSIALEITMDHLTEDPDYYEKLEKIEKQARVVCDRYLRQVISEIVHR